jgi:hypothetical protein
MPWARFVVRCVQGELPSHVPYSNPGQILFHPKRRLGIGRIGHNPFRTQRCEGVADHINNIAHLEAMRLKGDDSGQVLFRHHRCQAGCDILCGHTHRGNVTVLPHLGSDKITVIDLGCALPQGHIEPYAKHNLTGWTWGISELTIQHGSIQGYNFIPMSELERRYGRESA